MLDSFLQFNNQSLCFMNFYFIIRQPNVNDSKVCGGTDVQKTRARGRCRQFAQVSVRAAPVRFLLTKQEVIVWQVGNQGRSRLQ